MEYGKTISELRRKNNLTQAELGEKLNVTPQAVSKWENDLSHPDIDSLRKMSAIFNISLDEMLNVEKAISETKEKEAVEGKGEQTKLQSEEKAEMLPILGYCKTCRRAVRAGEFRTVIDKDSTQVTYCHSCYNKKQQEKQLAEKKKREYERQCKLEKSKKVFRNGFIWGIVAMVIGAVICFSLYGDGSIQLFGAICFPLGLFTMLAQIIWGNFICEVFLFFCRSFKVPFGFVFELSLDGILWLLTVKLALWIICGVLSILFFVLGVIFTAFLSLVVFPFTLPHCIKEMKKGEL